MKVGKYIGSQLERSLKREAKKDILGILKIVAERNLVAPNVELELVAREVFEEYKKI